MAHLGSARVWCDEKCGTRHHGRRPGEEVQVHGGRAKRLVLLSSGEIFGLLGRNGAGRTTTVLGFSAGAVVLSALTFGWE